VKTHDEVAEQYNKFIPKHYEKFSVTFVRGNGVYLEDIKGKKYVDMLAGYGAVNFGHNNPKLRHVFLNQYGQVCLTTGNFYNDTVAEFTEKLVNFTGLSPAKVLMMNTGAEAVEKAIKLCRRWGYRVKGVQTDRAEILFSATNFHGRTYGPLSASCVNNYRGDFGPFLPGMYPTLFNNVKHLKYMIGRNTVAFIVEPIQGEGGFIFPTDDYLKKAEEICQANNVLFVLDEIPTAFGRIGNPFPHFHYGVNPDMVILAKALGGGFYPVSSVVARTEIMDVLDPGSDGSTFGGNPLAAAIGLAAINLTEEENLAAKAKVLGEYFMKELGYMKNKSEMIKEVRGLGLFIGIELNKPFVARKACEELVKNGVVTAPARGNLVRFTPPLTITKGEVNDALEVIDHVFRTDIK